MTTTTKTIGVIGGGAWGTALANVQAEGGKDTAIWVMEPEVKDSINTAHENTMYMPGSPLNANLRATNDLAEIAKQDILLLVTPAQFMRKTLTDLKPHLHTDQPIIICSKGIELETGQILSVVAEETIGTDHPIAILSGPNFAAEIVRGMPAACTIAAKTEDIAIELQQAIGLKYFRPYTSTDLIGAQLGGAIKNVIAIASGIITGRNMGDSARAALLTRGLAETGRLIVALGGERETLLGMCGVGDLMLTATSIKSRNFSLGIALGEGKTLEEILGSRNSVTEGVKTAEATLKLAKKNAVDMPITEAIHKCLNQGVSIDDAIEEMLNRPFKY